MNYNSIVYPAGSVLDLQDFNKILELSVKNCGGTNGFLSDQSHLYNCNRCGNDKQYLQPLISGDRVYFQFQEPNTVISVPMFWKGYADPYLVGVEIVTGDELVIPMETWGYNDNAGNWIGTDSIGRLIETCWIESDWILKQMKDAGSTSCNFYLRFNFYNNAETIINTIFSEQYELVGCFNVNLLLESYDVDRQYIVFGTFGSYTRPLFPLTDNVPFEIHFSTPGGPVNILTNIHYSSYGLTPSLSSFIYIMNAKFSQYGIWTGNVFTAQGEVYFYSNNTVTITLLKINGVDITANIVTDEVFGTHPPLTIRTCKLSLYGVVFPLTADITIDMLITSIALHVTAVDVQGLANALNDQMLTSFPSNTPYWVANIVHGVVELNLTFVDSNNICTGIHINIGTGDHFYPTVNCFALLYSEPTEVCFQSCRDTVLIEGIYDTLDCKGNLYKTPGGAFGAGSEPYKVITRLLAKLMPDGFAYTTTKTDNDVIVQQYQREVFRLLGSPVPYYVAQIIGLVLGSATIVIDGVEYIAADGNFNKQITNSNMWRLDFKVTTKVCKTSFGCD